MVLQTLMTLFVVQVSCDSLYTGLYGLYWYTQSTSKEFILKKGNSVYSVPHFVDRALWYFVTSNVTSFLLPVRTGLLDLVIGLLIANPFFFRQCQAYSVCHEFFRFARHARLILYEEALKRTFGYVLTDLLCDGNAYFRFPKSYSGHAMSLRDVPKDKLLGFGIHCLVLLCLYKTRQCSYVYYKIVKTVYWSLTKYSFQYVPDKLGLKEQLVQVVENNWEGIDSPHFAHAIVDVMETKGWLKKHFTSAKFYVQLYVFLWSACYFVENALPSLVVLVWRQKAFKCIRSRDVAFKMALVSGSMLLGVHYLITNLFLLTLDMTTSKDLLLDLLNSLRTHRVTRKMK
jgi:hypothetical protein